MSYDMDACPRCGGETEFHCAAEDCELLRCVDCQHQGLPFGMNWVPTPPWDDAA